MKHTPGQPITTTVAAFTDEEAVSFKMKALHPKLFGLFCPVKYRLLDRKKVYVPYMFLIYSYELRRGRGRRDGDKPGLFDRQGEIGVVFDMNEVHAFHFDLYETLDLCTVPPAEMEGEILIPNCTYDEAEANAYETVKWGMLRRVLQALPELRVVRRELFYRTAWQLSLAVGRKTFEKYAYLDRHAAENEHIAGLKVRLAT